MNMHAIIPAADREVSAQDNEAPESEKLPTPLAAPDDLPSIIKKDVEDFTNNAVLELATFARVPDTIDDDDVYQRAVTLATRIQGVSNDLDSRRKSHKAPYTAAGQVIDDHFSLNYIAPDAEAGTKPRVLKKELLDAHKALKARLSDYDTRQHRAEQERTAAEREQLAAAAAADGIEIDAAIAIAAAPGTKKSAHGGSAVRKIAKIWEVIDANQLPRSLLMPNPTAIQALVDSGAITIPGVKIEEIVDTHTQRR